MKHIDTIVILFVLTGIFTDCGFEVSAQYSFWCAVGYAITVCISGLSKDKR